MKNSVVNRFAGWFLTNEKLIMKLQYWIQDKEILFKK